MNTQYLACGKGPGVSRSAGFTLLAFTRRRTSQPHKTHQQRFSAKQEAQSKARSKVRNKLAKTIQSGALNFGKQKNMFSILSPRLAMSKAEKAAENVSKRNFWGLNSEWNSGPRTVREAAELLVQHA